MKIKQLILTCCSLLFILTSCNNYLDVKPKGKIIPKNSRGIFHNSSLLAGRDRKRVPMLQLYLNPTIQVFFGILCRRFGWNISQFPLLIHNYMSVVVSIQIKNVILICIPLSKTAMLSSAIWKIQNQKWQKNILGTAWSLRSICYYNLLQSFL